VSVGGTNFQLKVWQALVDLGGQARTTYTALADAIDFARVHVLLVMPSGVNPVGWLIPCHTVLRKDGSLGGYHWGKSESAPCWRGNRFRSWPRYVISRALSSDVSITVLHIYVVDFIDNMLRTQAWPQPAGKLPPVVQLAARNSAGRDPGIKPMSASPYKQSSRSSNAFTHSGSALAPQMGCRRDDAAWQRRRPR